MAISRPFLKFFGWNFGTMVSASKKEIIYLFLLVKERDISFFCVSLTFGFGTNQQIFGQFLFEIRQKEIFFPNWKIHHSTLIFMHKYDCSYFREKELISTKWSPKYCAQFIFVLINFKHDFENWNCNMNMVNMSRSKI